MGKSKVEISVVIPVYNRAETIGRCLDSILVQTYPVAEILLVDDCSSDGLELVLQGYDDPKIKLLKHEENRGAQAARNTGIKTASSDWIAFLDSDDEWIDNKLEQQVAALKKVNFDPWTVVHTNAYKRLPESEQLVEYFTPKIEGYDCYSKLLKNAGPLYPTLLTSKKALLDIGLLDETIISHQEWDTSISLAKKCQFIHLDTPLLIYHIQKSNSISGNYLNRIRGYEQVITKHISINEPVNQELVFNHYLVLYFRAIELSLESEEQRIWDIISRFEKRELIKLKLMKMLNRSELNLHKKDWLVDRIVEVLYRLGLTRFFK